MAKTGRSASLFLKPLNWTFSLACLVGMGCFAATEASAAARVALVIGNGDYKSAPKLTNPSIDAHAVAASLKRLGFEVIEGYDLASSDMRGKLGEFSTAIREAKVALVYYAGHGVSIDEENYLLPTDLLVRSASELEINGLSVTAIMRQMKREERANIVILDACRDNPFSKDMAGDKRRGVDGGRGLSPIEGGLAKGSLIAFATDPKQTALDGLQGDNSPFTKALLKNIETPGITIDAMMGRVRDEVWSVTDHKQMPWVNTSLVGGDLYLNPVAVAPVVATAVPGQPAAAGPDRVTMENRLWDSAEKSASAEDYQVYVDAYPTGIYAQMAKNRIARLSGKIAAIVPQTAALRADPAAPASLAAEPIVPAKPPVTTAELKADIATPATEKLLNMSDALRRELKLRLKVLGFDSGSDTPKFDDKTRIQIGEWQKSHEISATTALSRIQVAALTEQSEAQYQRWLTAQPMVPTRSLLKAPARVVVVPAIRQAQQRRATAPSGGGAPRSSGGGGGGGGGGHGDSAGGAAAAAFFGGVLGGVLGGMKH